jgi:hypothetical protein
MNSDRLDVDAPTARTLLSELSAASRSLDAALRSDVDRDDRGRDARVALETFQFLERSPRSFAIPHRVRSRVALALSELEDGRLELADSDIRWAGVCFQ